MPLKRAKRAPVEFLERLIQMLGTPESVEIQTNKKLINIGDVFSINITTKMEKEDVLNLYKKTVELDSLRVGEEYTIKSVRWFDGLNYDIRFDGFNLKGWVSGEYPKIQHLSKLLKEYKVSYSLSLK